MVLREEMHTFLENQTDVHQLMTSRHLKVMIYFTFNLRIPGKHNVFKYQSQIRYIILFSHF